MKHPPSSSIARVAVSLGTAVLLTASGCGDETKAGDARLGTASAADLSSAGVTQATRDRPVTRVERAVPDGLDGVEDAELDLGADWAARADRVASTLADPTAGAPVEPPWAIVLGTYTGPQHAEAAARMVAEIGRVAPELTPVRPRQTKSGSMVVYGEYQGSDDPAARADLKRIKSMTVGGQPIFARAMLARVTPARVSDERNPTALASVRKAYPNVNPLYTLQVAVFSDFDSGELTPEEIRRKAEAYATELRMQGAPAYFDHDVERQISVVTVGLFDRRAVDAQSGLYSPDVQALMQKFPQHLVNGEVLYEPVDRFNASKGRRVQTPRLVLVPEE